jgi:hypothetical protein
MQLKILKPIASRKGHSTISFNKKGLISISKVASQKIGITNGDPVSLAFDEKKDSDWYLVFHKRNSEEGLPCRVKSNGSVTLNCTSFTASFFETLKIEGDSISVPLSTEGRDLPEENVFIYPIITRAALV